MGFPSYVACEPVRGVRAYECVLPPPGASRKTHGSGLALVPRPASSVIDVCDPVVAIVPCEDRAAALPQAFVAAYSFLNDVLDLYLYCTTTSARA